MGFTFDAPISINTNAYDKAHRRRSSTPSALPSSKPKRNSTPGPPSSSFLTNLTHRLRNRCARPSTAVSHANPTPATDPLFFRLPLTLRQQIYGYLVGQKEVLHILLKRKASSLPYGVAYRRCRAGGNVEDCITEKCREFLDIADGTYFGSFDRIGGLLLACWDIYMEASAVLYSQNVLDFDLPLSLITFSRQISKSSLHSIRSISFEPQRRLYVLKPGGSGHCIAVGGKTFQMDQWAQMWDVIASMQGLREVRVKFRAPWMGWDEKDVLDPLWKVTRPMKLFDVDAPWLAAEMCCEKDVIGRKMPFRLLGTG